jgi:transposase-like protein
VSSANHRRLLSDEQAQRALQMIASGASAIAASRALDVPKWAVDYEVRRGGGTGKLRPARGGPVRTVDRAAVVALYREGVPLAEVAARLNCNRSTVGRVLLEVGEKAARRIEDITGRRFGSLVALAIETKADNNAFVWRCRCDCGRSRLVKRSDLTRASSPTTACRICVEANGRACSICGERGHNKVNHHKMTGRAER